MAPTHVTRNVTQNTTPSSAFQEGSGNETNCPIALLPSIGPRLSPDLLRKELRTEVSTNKLFMHVSELEWPSIKPHFSPPHINKSEHIQTAQQTWWQAIPTESDHRLISQKFNSSTRIVYNRTKVSVKEQPTKASLQAEMYSLCIYVTLYTEECYKKMELISLKAIHAS